MPRKNRVPKYCLHKRTGHARVKINGQEIFLGKYGTTESLRKYNQLIAELRSAPTISSPPDDGPVDLTVVELIAAFLAHARKHYPSKSTEPARISAAVRTVNDLYGHTSAVRFGPKRLKAVRQAMIDQGLARTLINGRVDKIKRMFKWAGSEELVPPSVPSALTTVAGLRAGYTSANESQPVCPVSDGDVKATLPHLPTTVADMVRLQRLTGARPTETCMIRPADVDRTGDVWIYRPANHKTVHLGKQREICIGPKGQAVLLPYLLRADDAYCFSPAESEMSRRAKRNEQRRTPLSCGNRPGSNRSRNPKRSPGKHYTRDSYRQAVYRACDAAGIARWSPHRLRHTAATEIRRQYGLEASQVALGHASADVTQVYAERDMALARKVAAEVG